MKIQYFDVSNKIIYWLEALENALLRLRHSLWRIIRETP
jgi:hypothetical protein